MYFYGVGRGCGVGRGRGVTPGVALGVAVGVAVGVVGGVVVGVAVAVAVAVAVGVGLAPRLQKISIEATRTPVTSYPPASPMWKVPLVSTGKLRRAVVNGSPVDQVPATGS